MQLRPYQEEACRFIETRKSAGLFIDMGLGKTAATLHAMKTLPKPILLVGPIPVVETVWAQEARRWPAVADLTFSLVRGSPKERKAALAANADVFMINPELLGWLADTGPNPWPFRTLVVDESSMFKNPSSQRFKVLRHRLRHFERRVILTGTPSPNSLLELWPQIFMLDLGERLDTSFVRFKNRYFKPLDYHGYQWGPKDETPEALPQLIKDLIFRVENPGLEQTSIDNVIEITLPPDARRVYTELEREAFTRLASADISAATAVAALMKLRQAASGFLYDEDGKAHDLHSEKLQAARRVVDETGSPVLIVYQFKHELQLLQKEFRDGQNFAPRLVGPWNTGHIPVMFLHPASAGHGINLQHGGHTMVIYSGSFSLEQMSQTMKRIDRPGQKNLVVYHHLVATNTVDELIRGVLASKSEVQSDLLKALKEYARAKTNLR